MSRIGATLTGFQLKLLDLHAGATAAANLNSLRLASGENIQQPKDDVAGFVALSNFQAELSNVTQASLNVSNASAVVSGAQLLLDQIRTQLETIRAKAVADEDQQLSADERIENQAAIDEAVAEINLLVGSDVNGRRLLDGSADFRFSGLNASQVENVSVYALGSASSREISATITTAATQATVTYTGAGGLINSGDASFELSGSRGTTTISVTNGESLTDVRDRINLDSHLTGVTASVGGDALTLTSVDYGAAQSVEISVTSGAFAVVGSGVGTDGVATINGREVTGDGNRFSVSDNGFRFALEAEAGFTGAVDAIEVSGQALTFSLSSDPSRLSTLAIPGLQAARLGGPSGTLDELISGGALAGLGTNASAAIRTVDEVLAELTRVEGAVDGFANAVIASAEGLLEGFDSNLNDAIDAINQVDEEKEELLLNRNEALATNALAALANLNSHNQNILDLVRQVAGFSSF